MRIMSSCVVLLLVITGCSLGESEARRRVGHWDRYPEFRACVKQAVPEDSKYVQKYQSCIKLDVLNDRVMNCVRDITPKRQLDNVMICQQQLRDLVAYGTPNQGLQEPSEAWTPGIGNVLSVLF